jgi:hypothetical protein
MRIKDCPECLEYYYSQPHLVHACASVGISHNKTTEEMLVMVISGYHHSDHREAVSVTTEEE